MYGQFGRGGYLTYNFVHIISTSLLISVSIPFLHPPKKWETISMLIYMYFFIGKFKKKNCLLREKVWWYVPEIFTQTEIENYGFVHKWFLIWQASGIRLKSFEILYL